MRRILFFSGLCLAAGPLSAQTVPQTAPVTTTPIQTSLPVPVQAALRQAVTVPVKTMVTVAGKVRLPDGRSAANASLYLGWGSADGRMRFHKFQADAEGAFHLTVRLAPAPVTASLGISASVPGVGFVWHGVTSASDGLEKLDLKLKPVRTIHGRMVLADGRPAAHLPVRTLYLRPASRSEGDNNNFGIGPDGVRLLPDEEVAARWRNSTDAEGRFTLQGVPTGSGIAVSPGAGLTLTNVGSTPIEVLENGPSHIGVLVAARRSALQVRVLDVATGKPAANIPVSIARQSTAESLLSTRDWQYVSTAEGAVTIAGLLPGTYRVTAPGQSRTIQVSPGAAQSASLVMRVRSGPLTGRVLDANGRPVARCPVALRFPTEPGKSFVVMAQNRLTNGRVMNSGRNTAFQNNIVTNADGSFQIPNVLRGLTSLTLRAVQGNALAEWSGSPARIGGALTLKMRPNALMTVTGRLIDPQRHVLRNATCETLHWLPSARSTWFATAQTVKVDDQGRFRVSGLERGESFSIITTQEEEQVLTETEAIAPPQNVNGTAITQLPVRTTGSMQNLARLVPAVHDFESPRFVTRRDTDEQDMGDTMVHPNETPEENQQIYGETTPDVLASLPGFLPTPSEKSVRQAKTVLAQYRKALQDGDLDAAYRLTSRLSVGWSPHRSEFLLHGWFRVPENTLTAATRALPLVSRSAAAQVISFTQSEAQGAGEIHAEAAQTELLKHPDWVFLAGPEGDHVALTGMLRKEEGQWRVVSLPDLRIRDLETAVSPNGGGAASDFDRIASEPDAGARETAVQAGKQYLQTWASGDLAALLTLSPLSPRAERADPGQFAAALARRVDGGVCPIDRDEQVDLRPVSGLSLWDQERLLTLTRSSVPVALTGPFDGSLPAPREVIPPAQVSTFEYANANGKKFLMLLAKNEAGWHVVEPALPR